MKYVLITGVSRGIGYGVSEELVRHGFHIFGSVRKNEDGTRVRESLGSAFTPLVFDVTDRSAVQAAAERIRKIIGAEGLAGLVNNAGVAVCGPLMHISLDKMREQFEVNVLGVLNVTQAFLPLLGAQKDAPYPPGRIVNISSVSGRFATPFLGPYAASKHALEAMSDSLRRELMLYGIDLIVIEPGRIRTPIWDKPPDLAEYHHTDYGPILARMWQSIAERKRNALPVTVVSRVIRVALTTRRPKTRYVIPDNRLTGWLLPRWLPDRWFDRLIARQAGIT